MPGYLLHADWKKIGPGVEYAKLNAATTTKTDSNTIIAGMNPGKGIEDTRSAEQLIPSLKKILENLVDQQIFSATTGYLKVNVCEMLDNKIPVTFQVYLTDVYERSAYQKDSTFLANLSGARYISFVSKETAKKRYLEAGNTDWSNVLDSNPLPESIEVVTANGNLTDKELENLKSMIKENTQVVTDILWYRPSANAFNSLKKTSFYFEYAKK